MPLLTQVWDDVAHLCLQRRLDRLTRFRTMRRFGQVLGESARTAVISESMAAAYSTRYGARCEVIQHGASDQTTARINPTSSEEFVIGFSGGMYCPSAWKSFFEALAHLNWQAGGKRLRLVVMSGQISFSTHSLANVEYLGWRPDKEVQERLSRCDLLYLPQPFEHFQRPLAELSFPTKLSAYVSTGRPILVHGPPYASVVGFNETHPLGICCTTTDSVWIGETIDRFISDLKAYEKAAESVAHVANTVLSRPRFIEQVKSFLRPVSEEMSHGRSTDNAVGYG